MTDIELPEGLIYPDVDFDGMDGNAMMIVGAVANALRKAGNSREVVDNYREQALSGDYDHLLQVSLAFAGGE